MDSQNSEKNKIEKFSRIDFWGPGGHLHYSAEFIDNEAASLFLEDILDPSLDSANGPYYLNVWDRKMRKDRPCYHFSLRDIPEKLAKVIKAKSFNDLC